MSTVVVLPQLQYHVHCKTADLGRAGGGEVGVSEKLHINRVCDSKRLSIKQAPMVGDDRLQMQMVTPLVARKRI